MYYAWSYTSPLGKIELLSDENYLLGAWLLGQKYYYAKYQTKTVCYTQNDILTKACLWLEQYFANEKPKPLTSLKPTGTVFQQQVWQVLTKIDYGQTISYKDIAKVLKMEHGYQAIGQAVGRNPLLIFIPCHRVLTNDKKISGYAAGINNKKWLLKFEQS